MARQRISILATASVSRRHQEFGMSWLLKRMQRSITEQGGVEHAI
jgi:hypothetical protein